jgi:hypothetical protein
MSDDTVDVDGGSDWPRIASGGERLGTCAAIVSIGLMVREPTYDTHGG